jgi:hypothetical protein
MDAGLVVMFATIRSLADTSGEQSIRRVLRLADQAGLLRCVLASDAKLGQPRSSAADRVLSRLGQEGHK